MLKPTERNILCEPGTFMLGLLRLTPNNRFLVTASFGNGQCMIVVENVWNCLMFRKYRLLIVAMEQFKTD